MDRSGLQIVVIVVGLQLEWVVQNNAIAADASYSVQDPQEFPGVEGASVKCNAFASSHNRKVNAPFTKIHSLSP